MSPTTLRRIALALLIVLVLWGATKLLSRTSDSVSGGWVMPTITVGDADSAIIEKGAAGVTQLVKKQGNWTANGWPGDQEAVNELFRAIKDSSRGELVGQAKSSLERFSLDSANAIRLRVYSHGALAVDWTLGKPGTDYPSVYARRTKDTAAYMLHTDLGDIARKNTDQWRDRKITGVPLDSITSVYIERGRKSYGLKMISGKRWEFTGGKLADSSRVMGLLAHFVNVQASGFASRAQIDSGKTAKAHRHVVVKTGAKVALDLAFDSVANAFLVRQPHDSVVYRMETWAVGDLTPADSTLTPVPTTPPVIPIGPGKAPARAAAKSKAPAKSTAKH